MLYLFLNKLCILILLNFILGLLLCDICFKSGLQTIIVSAINHGYVIWNTKNFFIIKKHKKNKFNYCVIQIENFIYLTSSSNMKSLNDHNNSIFTTIHFDFVDRSILQLENNLKASISFFYNYKLYFARTILRFLTIKKIKL